MGNYRRLVAALANLYGRRWQWHLQYYVPSRIRTCFLIDAFRRLNAGRDRSLVVGFRDIL